METRIVKSLVVLGVPGVSLGIFYLLLKQFGFQFSQIGSTGSAVIAVLFLLISGGITFFALHQWTPSKGESNIEKTQLKNTLYKTNQTVILDLEKLKEIIKGLSITNRKLLIEIAKSPDGQYVSDLVINENLKLTRSEIIYRGKDLVTIGLLNIQIQTDHCLRFSDSVLRVVNNDSTLIISLIEN